MPGVMSTPSNPLQRPVPMSQPLSSLLEVAEINVIVLVPLLDTQNSGEVYRFNRY
jgi:hypothetical protein